jgi:hypothetical protein
MHGCGACMGAVDTSNAATICHHAVQSHRATDTSQQECMFTMHLGLMASWT